MTYYEVSFSCAAKLNDEMFVLGGSNRRLVKKHVHQIGFLRI